jgi:hypothetical protein
MEPLGFHGGFCRPSKIYELKDTVSRFTYIQGEHVERFRTREDDSTKLPSIIYELGTEVDNLCKSNALY